MESGGLTFLVVVSNDCNQDINGVSGVATVIMREVRNIRGAPAAERDSALGPER